jgi:hypothetical protein
MQTLIGPDKLYRTPVVSAPDSNGLALAYNQALADVLYMLDDEDLAGLCVNLRGKLSRQPQGTNPGSTDLAIQKVEAEAARRWNLRGGGCRWLLTILRGDTFL